MRPDTYRESDSVEEISLLDLDGIDLQVEIASNANYSQLLKKMVTSNR